MSQGKFHASLSLRLSNFFSDNLNVDVVTVLIILRAKKSHIGNRKLSVPYVYDLLYFLSPFFLAITQSPTAAAETLILI